MPWAVAPRSSGTAWLRKYIAARCAAPKLMACGHYSRNDRSVPQDEDGAASARPIGGKTDRRCEQDASEERGGEGDRDRVLVEPNGATPACRADSSQRRQTAGHR